MLTQLWYCCHCGLFKRNTVAAGFRTRGKKGNTNVENEFLEPAYFEKLLEMKIRFITFNDVIVKLVVSFKDKTALAIF